MLINLKEAAYACNLILNPKVIAIGFEQATFRTHFSNAKLPFKLLFSFSECYSQENMHNRPKECLPPYT